MKLTLATITMLYACCFSAQATAAIVLDFRVTPGSVARGSDVTIEVLAQSDAVDGDGEAFMDFNISAFIQAPGDVGADTAFSYKSSSTTLPDDNGQFFSEFEPNPVFDFAGYYSYDFENDAPPVISNTSQTSLFQFVFETQDAAPLGEYTLVFNLDEENGSQISYDGDALDLSGVQRTFTVQATAVPEPGTFVLLGGAVVGLAGRHAYRKRKGRTAAGGDTAS